MTKHQAVILFTFEVQDNIIKAHYSVDGKQSCTSIHLSDFDTYCEETDAYPTLVPFMQWIRLAEWERDVRETLRGYISLIVVRNEPMPSRFPSAFQTLRLSQEQMNMLHGADYDEQMYRRYGHDESFHAGNASYHG